MVYVHSYSRIGKIDTMGIVRGDIIMMVYGLGTGQLHVLYDNTVFTSLYCCASPVIKNVSLESLKLVSN